MDYEGMTYMDEDGNIVYMAYPGWVGLVALVAVAIAIFFVS